MDVTRCFATLNLLDSEKKSPEPMASAIPAPVPAALRTHSKTETGVPNDTQPKMRNWRVIHACEYARDVLPLVEGQVSVGMRPYIVTPQGAGSAELYLSNRNLEQPAPLSLLRTWHDVRNWRKSLLECDPESSADIVHSHSFASGMAAVRNFSCVVYDPPACIEELAISSGQADRGSWMGRSFRVAEQFIFSRAEAVIVHSSGMKQAVEERGAPAENVFMVPEVVEIEAGPPLFKSSFLRERFGIGSDTLSYFLPLAVGTESARVSDSVLSVLEAFAFIVDGLPSSALLIEAPVGIREALRGHAERLGVAARVFVFGSEDAEAVLQNVDVLIATGDLPADQVLARQSNQVCIQALSLGKALLAADVPRNRDCSPDGRGCLWFRHNDVRDLSHRIEFLGHNPDFRTSLASAGRKYILETRSSAAIGQLYDNAYRHALSRKKPGGPGQTNLTSLQPLPFST